jgi:hypothetical protein
MMQPGQMQQLSMNNKTTFCHKILPENCATLYQRIPFLRREDGDVTMERVYGVAVDRWRSEEYVDFDVLVYLVLGKNRCRKIYVPINLQLRKPFELLVEWRKMTLDTDTMEPVAVALFFETRAVSVASSQIQ